MTTTELLALAKQHHQAGDALRAEPLYRQVVQADPGNAQAWYLLGAACHTLNRPDEAADNFRKALRLRPRHAATHNHLGTLLAQQEKFTEAAACFQEALRVDPGFREAYSNLGAALTSLNRLTEAVAVLKQALRIEPNSIAVHRSLACALVRGGRFDEALLHLRKVVQDQPGCIDAWIDMGTTLKRLGRSEEGIGVLEKALRLQPDSAKAHNLLGSVLTDMGEFENAVSHFHESLRLKPDYSIAYHNLGRMARQGKYRFSDAEIDRMEQLLQESTRSPDEQSWLHFGLAHARDRQESYDEAFAHYRQGNHCLRQSHERRKTAFNFQMHRRAFDDLIATFTREFFVRAAPLGHPSERPIFIVGMPRSGTTLVEQILASHPCIAGAGELPDVQHIKEDLPQILRTAEKYPACLGKLTREEVRTLAERYLKRLERDDGQALRVTDKLPENYFHLGLIALMFPRARVIHCRRDPRDTCVSCFCEHFEGVFFATSLEDLGNYYGEYERLMAHWRKVLPLRMFEVRYEDLVADQETVTRQLVAFCGLDWDDRCLRFHQTRRPVQTASNVQVRQPLYASSIGRWKRYQAHLGPLLELLRPHLAGQPSESAFQPNSAEGYTNLARGFLEQEKHDDALICCRQALHLRPDDAELLCLLGVILSARGQLAEGIDCYRQALCFQPGLALAHRNLGRALAQQGMLEEADAHIREALRLQPTANDYFHRSELAFRGRDSFTPVEVERVEALLAESGTPLSERSILHFTLGNVLARRGACDEAFAHYRQGNDLVRASRQQRGLAFDVEKHRAIIEELEAVFHPGYFQRVESFGVDTELPIFIVGMPRSGTTLVEQILSHHPQVMGAGELQLISRMKTSIPGRMHAVEGYPACMRRIDRGTVQALGQDYLQSLARIGGPAIRVTDKLPGNFLHLGLIHTLFPHARIIHCRRHPLDVCLSCYFQHFDDIYYASSLEDLAAFYRHYERLMTHWRAVLPAAMFEIRYEDLVVRQEALSRELVAFCGLEWNDRCMAFHENPRAVKTASLVQVRQPIYESSVGRWKQYEKHLQPLIAALGDLDGATPKGSCEA